MRYSLLAGGKRIRPVLCLGDRRGRSGSSPSELLPAAAALELIHTYSLIHDDLPAMDDDDLRRGRPTSHVAHGEDVAILAGDALFAEAVRLIAEQQGEPDRVLAAVREIAAATGVDGMVGGQYVDVTGGDSTPDALRLPALAEDGPADRRQRLLGAGPGRSAEPTRIALPPFRRPSSASSFRSSTTSSTSPAATRSSASRSGSDERHGKVTYVSLFGLERARELAAESHARRSRRWPSRAATRTPCSRITDFISHPSSSSR